MTLTEGKRRADRGSYFEEELLPVQQVSNEHPQRSPPQALEKPLPVTLCDAHLPAEGEVKTQERVADVNKDRIHP